MQKCRPRVDACIGPRPCTDYPHLNPSIRTLNRTIRTLNPIISTLNPTIRTLNPIIRTLNPTIRALNRTIHTVLMPYQPRVDACIGPTGTDRRLPIRAKFARKQRRRAQWSLCMRLHPTRPRYPPRHGIPDGTVSTRCSIPHGMVPHSHTQSTVSHVRASAGQVRGGEPSPGANAWHKGEPGVPVQMWHRGEPGVPVQMWQSGPYGLQQILVEARRCTPLCKAKPKSGRSDLARVRARTPG